ncbi:MAG TPA: 4-carboxymuconolactone decarboxylase [Acidimicrobiales bacterium]|nr:4-carboxymuconolactone decarboxylase [Acidimicrobiales bacterium]
MPSDQTHEQSYQQGLKVRREVLGDAHVDRSLAEVSDFARPVQELVTEYCWGVVWSRDGLGRKTRSLLNLAMLTALNRPHEFAVHVRGALTNGASPAEIQETLLQTAVYVGVPAALESFRIADSILKEAVALEADGRGADGPGS